MKFIAQFIFVVGSIFSIGCESGNNTSPRSILNNSVVVLLYDISKSNDSYAVLKDEHLIQLFYRIAFNGGGKIYGYHIKTYSGKQEGFEYDVPRFDTLELIGNPYQINNRKKQNISICKKMEVVRNNFVSQAATYLIVPKDENFTDLKAALRLAKIALEQNNFNQWNKHLLIISDGLNDLPPNNGSDPIEMMEVNANVIMVRAQKTDYIKNNNPILTNSIHDGINNL